MSTFVKIASACGRKMGYMDVYDLPLNPWGFTCCNDCTLIYQSREAWMDADGNYIAIPTITRLSRVPDNDPFYVR